MKQLMTLLLLASGISLSAQHETLFSDWDVVGAFGGPIVEVGAINGEVGSYVGGGGALVLKEFFFGGYGLGNKFGTHTIDGGPEAGDYNIRFKHGGLWFGYVHKQHRIVHLYSSLRMGWGKADLRSEQLDFRDRHFTLTPEVGIEVNVFRFFKVGLAGGYRWVNGINQLPGLSNADFNSPVGAFTFRFGGFGDYSDWD